MKLKIGLFTYSFVKGVAMNAYPIELEKQLANAKFEEQAAINDQLRKLKAERNRLRTALEGRKETGRKQT